MYTKLISAFVLASVLAATPALAANGDDTLGVAVMSAIVDSDGTLLSGAGATDVVHNQAGIYRVNFVRNTAGCTAVGGPLLNSRIVGAQTANPAGVSVLTQVSSTLTFSDTAFSLIVFCAQ